MSEAHVISIANIVVGVDGSEASKEALRWAVYMAGLTGAKVRAVSAWHIPQVYGVAALPLPTAKDIEPAAQTSLDLTIKEALGPNPTVDVTTAVEEGPPALVLLHAAEGADLLVVGSRGHGAFAGMLLGSVSSHCTSHAHCPVVVIHHAGPDAV